jgi:acetyl esterase/lipase
LLKAGLLAMGAAPLLGAGSVLGSPRSRFGPQRLGVVAASGSEAVREYLDVLYCSHGEPLYGDLYLPAGGSRFPAVLVLHGGGFDSGDKSSMTPYARSMAGLGFAVFNANYRFSPPYPRGAPMQDAVAALRWLRRQSFVVKHHVGVMGASAGATMALTMATYGMVRAALSWSGACEKLAPAVTPTSSPCYLAHSTDDPVVPVSDAVDMAAALGAAGVDHAFDEVPGSAHGTALGKNRRVEEHTSAWLRSRVAGNR